MATIQENLRRHLFSNAAEALIGVFPQTAQLFNGVNYFYNGKVWNIQLTWDKNVTDDIQGVFIRVYSKDHIYGYHFASDNAKVKCRQFSYSKNSCSSRVSGPLPNTTNFSIVFIDHLREGRLAPEAEKPKLPLSFSNYAKQMAEYNIFFKAVPQLLPDDEPQQQPPIPLQPPAPPRNEGPNILRIALPLILLFGGVYMTVKIVQYIRNQLGQSALNNRGTGAVA